MTNDEPTGPWVLALGTLAIGIGAVAVTALRQRREEGEEGATGDQP